MPAAALVGLAAAPLWTAKCAYLTLMGNLYGALTDTDVEVVIVRFFGIFFAIFQSGGLWGNLISSLGEYANVRG